MKTKMTKKEKEMLYKIAAAHILALEDRGDLEQHLSDGEDFFETSVWSLEAALYAAYQMGKNSK